MNMETVRFDFYSYRPRMRVKFQIELHTVPVAGDFIQVCPKHITELSAKLKGVKLIKEFGIEMVVTKRTKYLSSYLKEDWRISLSPTEPLEDEK